jgi:hypothetical protein
MESTETMPGASVSSMSDGSAPATLGLIQLVMRLFRALVNEGEKVWEKMIHCFLLFFNRMSPTEVYFWPLQQAASDQSDRIGRIFAHWAIVYFDNDKNSTHFKATFSKEKGMKLMMAKMG